MLDLKQIILALVMALILTLNSATSASASTPSSPAWWDFQAIDTMKYSRDPSREFLSKPAEFEALVKQQVSQIADAGVTHIAIATPYDDEFLPILQTWVREARAHQLKIWFRGNWSGWEGWFGYPRITRDQHLEKTVSFVKAHPELFEDGDVFSACPECENGGPGDPRHNGDAAGHREFLIAEYRAMNEAFRSINRNVSTNYNSMNGDVARLIMDRSTTQALGGIVVVDHYVRTPEKLNQDVTDIALHSNGQVILGEFGAPIPDIHGTMTETQQAEWLDKALGLLATNEHLHGLSYWTHQGGSTALWTDNGTPKAAVESLKKYFRPRNISFTVLDPLGQSIQKPDFSTTGRLVTLKDGTHQLAYLSDDTSLLISKQGYTSKKMTASNLLAQPTVELTPISPSLWYRFKWWISSILNQF